VAGDMFADVPVADMYFLKLILHDWNDDECVQILKVILNRVNKTPAARLLVCDHVIPGPDKPSFSKLFDIHMMVWGSGKERTIEEFASVFARSGWKLVKVHFSFEGAPFGVVEAVPA